MTILTREALLEAIEAHLIATGQPASVFGRAVANDPALVLSMRRGRCPTLTLAKRIWDAIDIQQKGGLTYGTTE